MTVIQSHYSRSWRGGTFPFICCDLWEGFMSNMTLQRDAYLRQHKPTLERHGDDRPYNNNTWQSCAGRKFPISLCTSAVTLPPLSSFLNSKRSAPCSQSPGASTDEKDRFAAWFANEATKFDAATNDSQAAQICATVLPDAHFSSYLTLRPFCGPRMPQVGLHCGGLTSRDRGTSVRNGKITKKRRPSEGTKAPNVNIAFQVQCWCWIKNEARSIDCLC